MNFDDDDESDFSFTGSNVKSGNQLASLFNMNADSGGAESLKYKATKPPQQQQQQQAASTTSAKSSVLFFTNVQAFKYVNNRHEPHGKLGLAILSGNNTFKLLLYATKSQPAAIIPLSMEFKIALQKNNYSSFYDEHRQLWSVLFDTEELVAAFATHIALCKTLMSQELISEIAPIKQDLNFNDTADVVKVEGTDAVEIETSVTLLQNAGLGTSIENTQQNPQKVRLGRNKMPTLVEEMLVTMKQGDRRLFVLTGQSMQPQYASSVGAEAVVFYDVKVLRVKKSERRSERSMSTASDQPPLPMLSPVLGQDEGRGRSDSSVREMTKQISNQLSDQSGTDKAKLISRMAKMGQQMIPKTEDQQKAELTLDTTTTGAINTNKPTDSSTAEPSPNATFIQQQKQQLLIQQEQLQQQQQQQQMFLQSQLLQQQQRTNPSFYGMVPENQVSLIPYAQNNSLHQQQQLLMYPQMAYQGAQPTEQKTAAQQPEQKALAFDDSKILFKIELVNDKLENLKSLVQTNNQNMPSMDTNILLSNIQRIVKENEQYKKELYEKNGKIDEQNAKITDLLVKAQAYVEQKHLLLEQSNSSMQSSSEKNVNRVLELEQDKMRLTGDLSQLTAKISELNLEVNRVQKCEQEHKTQLIEVSRSMDTYKQENERLVTENASLQAKLDSLLTDVKKEKGLKKSAESQLLSNEEEISELKAQIANQLKQSDEKKRKFEQDRSQLEADMEELKRSQLTEINEFKDKLNRIKSQTNESAQDQLKQFELDMNKEWQNKLDKTVAQLVQKHERQLALVSDEKNDLDRQLLDMKEQVKLSKASVVRYEAESEELKQEIEALNVLKDKFERFKSQTILMKERYEGQIREMLDQGPDPEVIGDEVKKVMNSIYRQIKLQIKPEVYYSGNGIIMGMLKIIKIYTIRVLQQPTGSDSDEEDNEKFDVFSMHIYVPEQVSQEQFKVQFQQQSSIEVLSKTYIKSPEQNSSQVSSAVANSSTPSIPSSSTTQTVSNPMLLTSTPPNQVQAPSNPISTAIDTQPPKPFISSGIDLDDQVSLTVSQIPKSMDSSDEDGDDKSIQCINDEDVDGDAMDMYRKSQVPLNDAALSETKSNETLEDNAGESEHTEEDKSNGVDDNKTNAVEAKSDERLELEAQSEEKITTDVSSSNDLKQEELKDETITEVVDPLSTLEVATETVESSEEGVPVEIEESDTSDPKVDVPEPSPEPEPVAEESVPEPTVEETVEQEPEPEQPVASEPTPSATKEESPVVTKTKIPALSKGLFDDSDEDEEEEGDGLFSFTTKKEKSNPVEKTDEDEKDLSKSQTFQTPTDTTKTTTSATAVNLKFSPPPLFDEEDSNEKDEIDWFK